MKSFALSLHDAARSQTITDVVSFVGEDKSGSFGVLPGRERLVTCLRFGMARLRTADGKTLYLAMPGGVLDFVADRMTISARHIVISESYEQIHDVLRQEILDEEIQLLSLKKSFHTMETELMKRLLKTGEAV